MTSEPDNTAKPVSNSRTRGLKPFKPGYDPRRWLNGRGKKSPEQREGEEILRAVIWEEVSREFDTATMKPLENTETIDALRLSVRSLLKKRPELLFERIAGKVVEEHKHRADHRIEIVYVDEDTTAKTTPGTTANQAGTQEA